jgi:hypothetical protein
MGLSLQPTTAFQVLVGNGEELDCAFMCHDIQVVLDSHQFVVDLYVLPISGAEMVLGVEWLKSLGPVIMDYNNLSLQFFKEGQLVKIAATTKTCPEQASLHQLKRMMPTDSIDTCYQFQLIHSTPPSSPNTSNSLPYQHLLDKFQSLFHPPTTIPPSRTINHAITLTQGSNPVNTRPYRYPQFQKQEIEMQIKDMLQQGLIQHSSSAFSSPVLLVKKKDGNWRFCVDYRALNAITIKDRFPIPSIDELLDELYSTNWFSKLDLRSGYHQIRMNPDDVHKTAFRTHQGHYEFLVMPFGLCNAPSSFQATMNLIFEPFLRKFVIVFFDDILVYSKTLEDHLKHLETVFECLLTNQFFLKQSKCSFATNTIHYLGHVVSSAGVGPDPEKIIAMVDWPTPKTLKQLRGFLGLTGFYRKFIKNYASIAHPLTELLKKDAFHWGPEATAAFEKLKRAMTEAPVLALPDFTVDFIIETDASGLGMGAVLIQHGHPISYFSKKFCPKLINSSTYVRELCAIVSAVKKWRTYLLGRKFLIYTDQRSLRELLTQVIQTPEQQFYLAKLMGYSYEIVYKPGAQNKVADALSRVHESPATFLAITVPHLDFLDKIQQQLSTNQQLQHLIEQVKSDPSAHPHYHVQNQLLFYKNKLFIPNCSELKTLFLEEFHSSQIGGHSGITKTYGR